MSAVSTSDRDVITLVTDLLQLLHQLEPVHARHVQVQQHSRGRRSCTRAGTSHGSEVVVRSRVSGPLEDPTQKQKVGLLVVHGEDWKVLQFLFTAEHRQIWPD